MSKINHFKYFKTSPEIIKLAVMYYVRFPLSLRQVEDILHERGIDICYETIRYWWNKFGILFSREMKKSPQHHASNWRWHIDGVFVKINGENFYLWRAVDHEGTILDCYVSERRNKRTALKVLRKLVSRYGKPREIVTDKLKSYKVALEDLSLVQLHNTQKSLNNKIENSHLLFRRREKMEQISKFKITSKIHLDLLHFHQPLQLSTPHRNTRYFEKVTPEIHRFLERNLHYLNFFSTFRGQFD